MKRLLNFFKDVKKENIIVGTYNEGEDLYSPNYFLLSCKMAGIILLSTSSLSINVANAAIEKNSIPFSITVDKILNKYESLGLFSTSSIPVVKIVNSNEHSSSSHIAGVINSCDVKIALDSSGKVESLIPDVNINFNNSLYREASLNHEIAHCYNNKVFRNSGLSKSSERWMSEWIVGDYVDANPIKSLFEENFADTYGMMLTLYNHNFSKESITLLKNWKDTRKIKRESDEKSGSGLLSNSHQTDFSLDYLYNNIDKVKKMDVKEYANFAMEASSRSIMYILNSNRKMVKKIKLNNDGNWVLNESTNNVSTQGFEAINQVMDSYRNNIINYAKVLKYKSTIDPESMNIAYKNDIPEITKKVINSTNLFDKIKINSYRVNNHEISWNIEGGEEAKTELFVMLNGKKLEFEMDKIKDKYNYKAFKENMSYILSSPYEIKLDSKLEKIKVIKKELEKSPFEEDRLKALKIKMK